MVSGGGRGHGERRRRGGAARRGGGPEEVGAHGQGGVEEEAATGGLGEDGAGAEMAQAVCQLRALREDAYQHAVRQRPRRPGLHPLAR